MERKVVGIDSLVVFRNSQGVRGRGTLVHLTRNLVVFEVYNPYSIVQLSEVLRDLQILRGERTIYTGRAVVSNLVATGLMLIVSATLVDPWQDLAGLAGGQELDQEIKSFVQDWEASHQISPAYQLVISNLRAFLGELSRWVDQVEVSTAQPATDAQQERVDRLDGGIFPKMAELFGRFEQEAQQVAPEEEMPYKAFARRELHPLMLCAPFVHRTFSKPLGYAGDYEMVNMILRDRLEGPNTYAKLVNSFILRSDTAEAHRNRIKKLTRYLHEEAVRVAERPSPLRVLNIGCGPADEVRRFIATDPLSERCEFRLMDFNQETLGYAKQRVEESIQQAGRRPGVEFVHRSINDLLKEAAGRSAPVELRYDLVYCAGLFDYLSDKICKRLLQLFYSWVEPGGLVVATNVHPKHSARYFLEHLLEWHLVLRDEKDMFALAPEMGTSAVCTEETGVNVFLEIRSRER